MRCFTIPQTRYITQSLIDGQYKDTMLVEFSDLNDSLVYALKVQKQIVAREESVMATYRNENSLRNEETVACEKQKELVIKSQRKDKFKKIIVAVLIGFCTGVILEKH